MTVREIIEYNGAINEIIENQEIKLPALIKFKLLGMLKQFESTVANFEKVRSEKVMELGTPELDEEGKETGYTYIDKNDTKTIEVLTEELSKILESEAVGIEIQKFKAEDIMDSGIPTQYLLKLYNIIEQ